MMLGQTRVLFAMSRDGLMPRSLAKTNAKGIPMRITLIVGGIVAVLAAFFPMGTLEEMVNIGTLFAFVLVCVGVIVLRRTRPDLPRGFRVPLVPFVPIVAVLACGWLMLNLSSRPGSGSSSGWPSVCSCTSPTVTASRSSVASSRTERPSRPRTPTRYSSRTDPS